MGSDSTKGKVTEKQLVKDLQAGEMGSFEQLANLYDLYPRPPIKISVPLYN